MVTREHSYMPDDVLQYLRKTHPQDDHWEALPTMSIVDTLAREKERWQRFWNGLPEQGRGEIARAAHLEASQTYFAQKAEKNAAIVRELALVKKHIFYNCPTPAELEEYLITFAPNLEQTEWDEVFGVLEEKRQKEYAKMAEILSKETKSFDNVLQCLIDYGRWLSDGERQALLDWWLDNVVGFDLGYGAVEAPELEPVAVPEMAVEEEPEPGEETPAPTPEIIEKSPEAFMERYGALVTELSSGRNFDVALIAAVLFHESDGGMGFVNGKLFIRFEVHHFLSIDGGSTPGSSSQYAKSEYYKKYFDVNTGSISKGHKWRVSKDAEYTAVHPTGTRVDNDLQWEVFEFAKTLNPDAAYNAISMGIPQIMGFNHASIGYNSAKEMFDAFTHGNEAQIRAFFTLVSNNSALSDAFESYTTENMKKLATAYNGGGDNENYIDKIAKLYPLFKTLN